jgi:hypothetical protein
MKTIITKPTNEQARKEIKQFTYASIISSSISIVIFWWLAMVGIFLGARGLMLTRHRENTKDENLILYRTISVLGIVIGIVSWFLYSTSHK